MQQLRRTSKSNLLVALLIISLVFILTLCTNRQISYAGPISEDNYEPNSSLSEATDISNILGKSLGATLYLEDDELDEDWYVFLVDSHGDEAKYRVEAIAWPGLTLTLELYGPAGNILQTETTSSGTLTFNFKSSMTAYYAVRVLNDEESTGNYQLRVSDLTPEDDGETSTPESDDDEVVTPQPTVSTPEPTPDTGGKPDFAEPNWDFAVAYRVVPGDVLSNLNFAPTNPNQIDNDYFKMAVVPNQSYLCRTDNLSTGLDTNLIIFNQSRQVLGGNDDINIATNEINSSVTFSVDTEQEIYILVGYKHGDIRQPGAATYTLSCSASMPDEMPAQAPSAGAGGTGNNVSERSTMLLTTADIRLIRSPDLPDETPVLDAQVTQIPLLIGYDRNGDERVNPNEGASGISVRVYNARTNEEIDHALTRNGSIQFVIASADALRVEIPLLGISIDIDPGNTETQEIVLPAVLVPPVLP